MEYFPCYAKKHWLRAKHALAGEKGELYKPANIVNNIPLILVSVYVIVKGYSL